MKLIKQTDFSQNIITSIYDTIHSQTDQFRYHSIIATIALYHFNLDRISQVGFFAIDRNPRELDFIFTFIAKGVNIWLFLQWTTQVPSAFTGNSDHCHV